MTKDEVSGNAPWHRIIWCCREKECVGKSFVSAIIARPVTDHLSLVEVLSSALGGNLGRPDAKARTWVNSFGGTLSKA
jgi:hypothetical protein